MVQHGLKQQLASYVQPKARKEELGSCNVLFFTRPLLGEIIQQGTAARRSRLRDVRVPFAPNMLPNIITTSMLN